MEGFFFLVLLSSMFFILKVMQNPSGFVTGTWTYSYCQQITLLRGR